MSQALITVSTQAGGPECERFFPYESAFRELVVDKAVGGFPEYVKELALMLRISGSLIHYEGQPVEEFSFYRKRKCVSVDWLIAEREWRGKSLAESLRLFALRVRQSIPFVVDNCKKNFIDLDEPTFILSMGQHVERIEHAASEAENQG